MLEIGRQTGADGKLYKVCNGTWYHADTLYEVISWLETYRERHDRIRVTYGKVVDGQVQETYKRVGYVSRSLGQIKVPLTVYNDRSWGGQMISSEEVVKIEYANKRNSEKVVWSHPAYQTETVFQGV